MPILLDFGMGQCDNGIMMKRTKTANVTPTKAEIARIKALRDAAARIEAKVESQRERLERLEDQYAAAVDAWARASYVTYHARNINGPASFSFYEKQ